jgi:hypothetical protein
MPQKTAQLTPASTRVMSSTFIPAKGRLDASPLAVWVVAMLREMTLRRLNCGRKPEDRSVRRELLNMRFAILRVNFKRVLQ